jgi:hypothetical protein
MSKRVPPPPTDEAPISSEVVVEIVKKRLAAPRDPPPSGLTGFKPKNITGTARLDFDDDARPDPKASRDHRYEVEDESFDQRRDQKNSSYNNYGSRRDDDVAYGDRERDRQGYTEERSKNLRSSRDSERDYNDYSRDSKDQSSRYNSRNDPQAELVKPKYSAEPKYDAQPISSQSKGGQDHFDGAGGQARPQRMIPFDFAPILSSTYRNLRDFVLSPVDPGTIVRCYIERNRSGMNMLYPVFTLCADMEDGTGRELMACRKIAQSMTSYYVFSLKSEDLYRSREQRSRLYLGKLRHVSATEYVLFDDGTCMPNSKNSEDAVDEEEDDDNPAPSSSAMRETATNSSAQAKATGSGGAASGEGSLFRKELAVISFNTTTRPVQIGVRGCEVGVPAVADGFAAATDESIQHFGRNHTGIITTFRKARQAGLQNAAHYRKCFIMHEKASK